MMDEMIKEENQMVENKDYRLTMEQMLVDGNTRSLLVSVQAKNKESWRNLCEEDHYDILEGNIDLREDYLGMEVKVQGIDVENTTVKMTPDKLKLCEEVQIETFYIDRLRIDMVGNCEKDVLWDTEQIVKVWIEGVEQDFSK